MTDKPEAATEARPAPADEAEKIVQMFGERSIRAFAALRDGVTLWPNQLRQLNNYGAIVWDAESCRWRCDPAVEAAFTRRFPRPGGVA